MRSQNPGRPGHAGGLQAATPPAAPLRNVSGQRLVARVVDLHKSVTTMKKLPELVAAGHLLVDEVAIAQAIGMSVAWVRKDRRSDRILPFVPMGRSVRYSPARVAEALAKREEGGTTKRRGAAR